MVETQREIRRLTKEYDTLKSEIINSVSNPVPTSSASEHDSGPSHGVQRKKLKPESQLSDPLNIMALFLGRITKFSLNSSRS
jgi:hypothetical protein